MPSTTYDYFLRACQRSIEPLRGTEGDRVSDESGNTAIFWIETAGRRIRSARYRATTCTTLVALCEHLSEIAVGLESSAVLEMTAAEVLALHPDIPAAKHGSVDIALAAMQSAIRNAGRGW